MAEQYANDAASTIVSDITAAATSVTITDASKFPTVPTFRVRCENEIMIVTAVAASVFTITRGAEGTTAAAHVAGTAIGCILSRDALLALPSRVVLTDTLANRPAAAQDGRLFFPTDHPVEYRDNGTLWVPWGPMQKFVDPPDLTGWTWLNQGSATRGARYISVPAASPAAYAGLYKAIPSAPYTLTACMVGSPLSYAQYIGGGMVLRDNTDKTILFIIQYSSGWQLYVLNMTNYSTWSSTPASVTIVGDILSPCWFRVVDDNTNRTYYFSRNGRTWYQIYQTTRTTWITPTGCGFESRGGTSQAHLNTLLSWEET